MKNTKRMLIFLLAILMLAGLGISANAAIYDDYAPILYFEGEETCFPIAADYHIQNSDLYQFEGDTSNYVSGSLTGNYLAQYSTDNEDSDFSYLDNQLGTVDGYDTIISDASAYEETNGNTVYYKVHTTGQGTVVQYWMFYAFNPGELNQHEGDWEMVQVVIPTSSEKWVAYSQHHSGQQATWDQVEKDQNHVKVFVSRGSHASFLRDYSGKLGMGMGSDYVGSNGKVLTPNDYTLVDLDAQAWIDYDGMWGEVASPTDLFMGRAGSQGPQFREGGEMWNDPISWGQNLPAASDVWFVLEWVVYNLITIYIVVSIVILALLIFRIYRRHKKYGLGPRKMSLLYIDGLNLNTIGNILCIVGIIVAIVALFYNWYLITGDFSIGSYLDTGGEINIVLIDGINGFQVNMLGQGGVMPLGAFVVPFSVFLAVGIIFMIISTIGVNKSSKLGWKYLGRGIRLFVPVIIILIGIMLIGNFAGSMAEEGTENYVAELFGELSSSPFGGSATLSAGEFEGEQGTISMEWGLGLGSYLLLLSGIIMFVSGILEFAGRKVFFEPKVPYGRHKALKHKPPVVATTPPEEKPVEKPKEKQKEEPKKEPKQEEAKNESEKVYCPHCGRELKKGATFCADCGGKI